MINTEAQAASQVMLSTKALVNRIGARGRMIMTVPTQEMFGLVQRHTERRRSLPVNTTEFALSDRIEEKLRGKSSEEILKSRNSAETTKILTRFKAKLDVLQTRIDNLPKIGAKAVNYALTMYPKIERWREDTDFDIVNNLAERAARSVAQAR